MVSQGSTGPLTIVADGLLEPEEHIGPVAVTIADGKIQSVLTGTQADGMLNRLKADPSFDTASVCDLRPRWLAPGYVDLHIHGMMGHNFTTGTLSEYAEISSYLPTFGVTAFCPTISTAHPKELQAQIEKAVTSASTTVPSAAESIGIRLEGPFISPAKRGAQYGPAIRAPNLLEIEAIVANGRGSICIVDFAPEEDREGVLVSALRRHSIRASIGHTSATFDQAIAAINAGASHATHLFNAMSELNHRAPGVPGAFLTDQRTTVEVIADGIHLHPAILKLVVACKGKDKVALVTDSIAETGLPDGEYETSRYRVRVRSGVVKQLDGTLAGSTLRMDHAVRFMVYNVGCSWSHAVEMATLTPARIAGVADRKGRIAAGYDADLIALDESGIVCRTWTRGRLAYNRTGTYS